MLIMTGARTTHPYPVLMSTIRLGFHVKPLASRETASP